MEVVFFPYTEFRMSYTFWLVLITHNVPCKDRFVLVDYDEVSIFLQTPVIRVKIRLKSIAEVTLSDCW